MSKQHTELTVDIFDKIQELIAGYSIIAQQKQKILENDPQKLHNYMLTQIVDLFDSIKQMVDDESLSQLLAEKWGGQDYGKDFTIKNQYEEMQSSLNQVKNQILEDPRIKDQKNIYIELQKSQNETLSQYQSINTQLQDMPQVQTQFQKINKLMADSFNLLDNVFDRQENQSQEIIKKLDDLDEQLVSKFQGFADQQNLIPNQQQQQPQSLHQPKIKIEIPQQLEEEKSNQNDDQPTLIAIATITEGVFGYLLSQDSKNLQKLIEQKQSLLQLLKDRDTEKTKNLNDYSKLIDQFLNTLMSSVQFSDSNDEIKAKSYIQSVINRLNHSNFDNSLLLIEKFLDQIFIHLDNANASLDKSLAIAETDTSEIVSEVLTSGSSKKMIYSEPSKIIMTREYNDMGQNRSDSNYTIIKANNGKVLQGGNHNNLYVLGCDLKKQEHIYLSDCLYSGMAIGKRLFCGQGDAKVTVYDEDTLELIATINTQKGVRAMLLIEDDYLLIVQNCGYIDIIQISTLTSIFQHQLDQDAHLIDIIKTSNPNEYAFAHSKGIIIATIQSDANNNFTFIQTDSYLNGKTVWQIVEVQSNILIACVYEMKDLQVIDRNSKEVIKTIPNASSDGIYNCLQKVIGYDDETFPYLLLKDQYQISIINTKTFAFTNIITSLYNDYCCPYSMVQYQENNEIRLLALYWKINTWERSTKEFVIGTL